MTSSISPLGVAVVGLGGIGRIHAENLACGMPSGRLVQVMDIDAETVSQAAQQLDVPGATDVEAVVANPAVDAIVIATPASTHRNMVQMAADAGRHVLCEKPLAGSVLDAAAAVEAARNGQVQLQVGFHRRFDRNFMEVRKRLEAGDLGDVYMYFASMRDANAPSDDILRSERLLMEATIHDFDAARWLVGEIVEVTAHGTQMSSPIYREIGDVDSVVVVLRFASGAIGTIESSRVAGYGFDCRTEVLGSQATVRVNTPHRHDVEVLGPGQSRHALPADFLERFRPAYRDEIEDFCRRVAADRPVAVTGVDGLEATLLATAAETSLRESRTVNVSEARSGTASL